MNIQYHVPLKAFNTLAINAFAEAMVQVNSVEQACQTIRFAQDENLAIKILGGGSNVVLPKEVKGLVVQYTDQSCEILAQNDFNITIRVGAGQQWHDLVMFTLEQGWYGLENLALIPGHVGAAPVQNIGAYGVEVRDFIKSVQGVYLQSGEVFELTNAGCQFGYRESIFKQALDGKVLITSVEFVLNKQANVNVNYAPLNQMSKEQGLPTPSLLAQWVIQVRKSKLPDPKVLPNAGSFFKNPVITLEKFERLQTLFDSVPHFKQADGIKVPAGWLIDKMGFKGKSFGLVSVHKQQALVLINHDGSAEDVLTAASEIKQAVKDAYDIELEQEPRIFA